MNRLFKNLMLVAVAAMAFVGCTQSVGEIDILPKQTVLKFSARFVDDTRAYFGEKGDEGYPVYWAGGEYVRFVAPAADNDGTYETWVEAVKADELGEEATFDVVFNYPIQAGTIYAYLGDWNIFTQTPYVNSYQTPTATSVDPNCVIAWTSFEYDGETMDVSGDFAHGVGYGKMSVNGFEGKTISSVQLSFDGTQYKNYNLNVEGIEEHTFWFAAEENEVTSFTITVVVDGVSYSKEVEIASDRHLYFKKGLVSKFSVSGLVKDPVMLDMPVITTSFADGKVTVAWDAVENADSYTVKVNNEVVAENYKETSYSFVADYGTSYYITVTANAAEGSTDYLNSYESSTSYTTPLDINMATDYTVNLTSYTIDNSSSNGKLFKFVGDTSDKWINVPVNPNLDDVLPAGTYTPVYGSWSFSSDASLEFNWYDTQYNYASMYVNSWANEKSAVEVVREADGAWSITIIVTNTNDNYTIKYVYSEEGEDPNKFADTMWSTISWDGSNSRFILTDDSGSVTQLYLNSTDRPGNNSIIPGTYKYDSSNRQSPAADKFGIRNFMGASNDGQYLGSESEMTVTFEDGVYKILIHTYSSMVAKYNDKTYGYIGMPEGWVAPEGSDEPEETTTVNVSLNAIEHYYYNEAYYYREFKFSDGTNNNVLRAAFDTRYCSESSINAGTYTHSSLGYLQYAANYSITYLCVDGQAITERNNSEMTVAVDGDNYTITVQITSGLTIYNVSLNGSFGGSSVPVDPTALATPSNFNVTYNGTSATITWDKVDGADYYSVTYGTTVTNTISNSVTIDGLSYDTDYTVSVVAYPSDTTMYTNSAAGSTKINIGADPNVGGNDVVITSASYTFGATDISFSDGTHTIAGKIIYSGRFPSGEFSVVAGEPESMQIGNVTLDGTSVNPTGTVIATANITTGAITFDVNIVIDGTTYKGSVAVTL